MDQAHLVALHRSTAMLTAGAPVTLEREQLLDVLSELMQQRTLLARLGTDLRSVTERAP